MNRIPFGTYPTFARELLRARAELTVVDEVGLALRAHRRVLALPQRGYAALRGWSKTHVARLESDAGSVRFADVVDALVGTGYALGLYRTEPPEDDCGAVPGVGHVAEEWTSERVAPESWPRSELVARVRDGTRRFPGHRETKQISSPPPWWFCSESTRSDTEEPHWYAPGPSMWDGIFDRAG